MSTVHHQEYLNTVYTRYVFVIVFLLASASVVRMELHMLLHHIAALVLYSFSFVFLYLYVSFACLTLANLTFSSILTTLADAIGTGMKIIPIACIQG
jgi:hypothetical protein